MDVEGGSGGLLCRCLLGRCALGLHEEKGRESHDESDQETAAVSGAAGELLTTPIAEDVLSQLVETVAKVLHLPYVAIELMQARGRVMVASRGNPTGTPAAVPLTHQGEIVAWMLLAQRSSWKALRKRDDKVLRDLVPPVGAATQTLRQAVELQRSREQLVADREEERRRLRRNLHDGVGPSVAANALHLQVAEELICTDPDAARELIERVRAGSEALVEEIRRLVDFLGHSNLDQVGLLSAIRERAACVSGLEVGEVASGRAGVRIETVGDVEELPAAIEVAAFHIASKALADAFRHGAPTNCLVRLSRLPSNLEVEVVGDGCDPAADFQSSTELSSMRERAAELGGTLSVEPFSAGRIALRARLPLPRV